MLLETEPAWRVAIAEIRAFLGDAPASTPATTASSGDLSERELEVLRLIADGKSNQQIAETLFISVKTAGNHVSNILGKTNASNRSEAVAQALRNGLI